MEEYQKTIEEYKQIIEAAKTTRTRAETKLEQLKMDEEAILKQMAELDVTPETITSAIKDCEAEADRLLLEAGEIVKELKAVI